MFKFQLKCLCAFFIFLDKRKKYIIFATLPHSQGYSNPRFFFMLSSPPQPHSPFIKGKKKYTISRKCQWNTYFFYLCLSVSVVSSVSACFCVMLCSVFQSFILELNLFLYEPHNLPSHFYQLFFFFFYFAHVVVYNAPFPQTSFSVSFSQFQNSLCLSLSLFSLCWDRVLRVGRVVCPPYVVSFRYYIEFNDNDII